MSAILSLDSSKKELTQNDEIEKKQIKEERRRNAINRIHIRVRNSVLSHDRKRFDATFEEPLLDINFTDDTHKILPIECTIRSGYDYAFNKIAQYKTFDVNTVSSGNTTALYTAVFVGNERYAQTLIDTYKANPHVYCKGSLLSAAITSLDPFSVLKNSQWKYEGETAHNPELAKRMQDFFFRTGEFTPTKFTNERPSGESVPFPKPTKTIHAYYIGKVSSRSIPGSQDIVGLLLGHGVSLDRTDAGSTLNPIKFVEDPNSLKDQIICFGITGREYPIQYIEHEGDHVHKIKMQFRNCAFGETVEIIVHYDMKPTRTHILAAQARLLEEEKKKRELNATTDNKLVSDAMAAVDSLKKDMSSVKTTLSPLAANYSAKERIETRVKNTQNLDYPGRKNFFDQISKPLDATLCSYKTLSTGLYERSNTNTADFLAVAFKGLSGCLPAPFSTGLSLVEKLTRFYADHTQQAKHTEVMMLLPKSPADCTESIALELTEWLDGYLINLSKDQAETLAKKVRGVILVKLCDQAHTLNANEPIARQLIHAVQTSDFFKDHLKTLVKSSLESKRKKIDSNASQKALFTQIHTKLINFWAEFSLGFAKAADSKANVDLGTLVAKSLEKNLHPVLRNDQTVSNLYARYLREMTAGEKVKTLNPLTLELLAIELTEMVSEQADNQNAELPSVKQAADLENIAQNVANHAINNIFVNLCTNFDSDGPAPASQPKATVTTSSFSMRAIDDTTLNIMHGLKQDPALQNYLNQGLAKNLSVVANTTAAITSGKPMVTMIPLINKGKGLEKLASERDTAPVKQHSPSTTGKLDSNSKNNSKNKDMDPKRNQDPKMPLPNTAQAYGNGKGSVSPIMTDMSSDSNADFNPDFIIGARKRSGIGYPVFSHTNFDASRANSQAKSHSPVGKSPSPVSFSAEAIAAGKASTPANTNANTAKANKATSFQRY